MGEWSFCRKCGWHSMGNFDGCPSCNSKRVHHLDNDLPLDAKDDLFMGREKEGQWPSVGETKEKNKPE